MRNLILLLCFISFTTQGQSLKAKDSFPLKADRFIGKDAYDHIYFIKDAVLHKQGNLGSFVFRDYQLGPVQSVDIINPLNVVVFYAEMNTVVLLDNRLNEKERINFNELPELVNCGAVANAGNNKLWLFNIDLQQLQLYDYRAKRHLQFPRPILGEVSQLDGNFNDCFVVTSSHFYQFNVYGSLLMEAENEGIESLVRNDQSILVVKENRLFSISEETIKPLNGYPEENPIKDLQLTQEFLYIYDGNKVDSFTLTQPKQ